MCNYSNDYFFCQPPKFYYFPTISNLSLPSVGKELMENPSNMLLPIMFKVLCYYWCYTQKIPVINNARWGTEETWEYCFDGIEKTV
jgi:hypothetical protein